MRPHSLENVTFRARAGARLQGDNEGEQPGHVPSTAWRVPPFLVGLVYNGGGVWAGHVPGKIAGRGRTIWGARACDSGGGSH
eukprot:3934854-Rhodomonas_salina.1